MREDSVEITLYRKAFTLEGFKAEEAVKYAALSLSQRYGLPTAIHIVDLLLDSSDDNRLELPVILVNGSICSEGSPPRSEDIVNCVFNALAVKYRTVAGFPVFDLHVDNVEASSI